MIDGPTADNSALEALMADIADDFVLRRKRGESIDVEEYARSHPEHAHLIRQVLSSLELLGASTSGLSPGPEGNPPSATPCTRLGDFRLVREIGRGGMGIVYEAVQVSLGRPVAVKVLPFASALDPRQLQRFLNEARAAALLHHPHIVPVYSVGADNGLHFFAMQYIPGTNLAAVLEQMRAQAGADDFSCSLSTKPPLAPAEPGDRRVAVGRMILHYGATRDGHSADTQDATRRPVPSRDHSRWVARLGVQAALALEHAHAQGVVHRDVKPSNLLLDSDGDLWVTDFGLARSGLGTNLTATGDMVGTFRYMSPEQALGKPVLVDHRTDVYSLGLTLYELITLRPAFLGFDRAALIRQIAEDDPPPPRRLAPGVPADLETIVLKSMAKAPEQRYSSAQELADDLERFLADRPIRARPPSLPQRARRWARRHRSLAVALGVAAALLVVGVVCCSLGYAVQQRRFALAKDEHARKMEAAERKAKEGLYRALLSEAKALRLGRVPGYRRKAWEALKEAVALDVPGKDMVAIRAQALACLGDPIGLGEVKLDKTFPPRPPKLPKRHQEFLEGHGKNWPQFVRALSPDQELLAFGFSTNSVVVTDQARETMPSVTPTPLGVVYEMAFTPDGKLLVAGCEEGVAVWTLPERNFWRRAVVGWKGPGPLQPWSFARCGNTFRVAPGPSGRLLATAGQKLELWSLTSNRLLLSLPLPAADARPGFTEDGRLLLALDARGKVLKAWPVAETPEKSYLAGHSTGVPSVAFSPDGELLASVSKDHTLKLWDVKKRTLRLSPPLPKENYTRLGAETVAFSPGGKLVAVGNSDGLVHLFDRSGRHVTQANLVSHGRIWRLRFDHQGGFVVVGDRGLTAWRPRRDGNRLSFSHVRSIDDVHLFDVALHPSGETAIVMDDKGRLIELDIATGKRKPLSFQASVHLRSLEFDPSGRFFTFVSTKGELATCDWGPKGEGRRRVRAKSASITALGGKGRWAATAIPGQSIAIHDLESNREWLTLPAEGSDIWSLAWSPDGARMAVGLSDGGVAIWNLQEVRSRLAELGCDVPALSSADPEPKP
jgi:serine/threonine protein kinase/WD40 repeat protein